MKQENRYTRLKSIKEFGYDVDWEDLFDKNILVIGVGGIGSVVAETLTRCGIGKLTLIDLDTVEEVNLNRLFYKIEHIGSSKVEAAKKILKTVNPNVIVISLFKDVCDIEFEKEFEKIILESDLVYSCLDNFPARLYINEKCVKLNRSYVDTGATRSGLGGYIHLVIPKETACYNCTGSIDLGKKEEGEACTASLPTTITILASLASEIGLKYLLDFGIIPDYIGFNALTDQLIIQKMKRDEKCFICGETTYTIDQKEKKIEEVEKITEGKEIGDLLNDLIDMEDENE